MKYYFPVILIVIFSLSLLLVTELFDDDDPETQENKVFEQIEIKDLPVL